MTKDQIAELEAVLLEFIKDTAKNTTSEDAIKVLPEVVKALVELRYN